MSRGLNLILSHCPKTQSKMPQELCSLLKCTPASAKHKQSLQGMPFPALPTHHHQNRNPQLIQGTGAHSTTEVTSAFTANY